MRRLPLYIFIIILTAAAGCCPCRYARKHPQPLTGTTWHLQQLSGADVQCTEGTFDITFGTDGRLTGTGGCNRFSADYASTPKRALDIGMVTSTRMFCPESEREQRLFQELDDATHYEIDGSMLLILNNGEVRAIFSAVGTK